MSSKVANHGDGVASMGHMQSCIETLSGKMDRLITVQEKVLSRLDEMSQDIGCIEKDMEDLKVDKEEIHILPKKETPQRQPAGGGLREMCQEMSSIMSAVNQRSEQQAEKLDGMEKLVLGMQQMVSLIGETVKTSRVVELMFKGSAARKASKLKDSKGKMAIKRQSSADTITKTELKDHKGKDGKEKPRLSLKGLKTQKKKKPPDAADTISLRKQALLLEEVQKLNRENAERSGHQASPGLDLEAGESSEESKTPMAEEENLSEGEKGGDEGQKVAVKEETSKPVKEEKSKPEKTEVEKKEAAATTTTEAQKTETKPLTPPPSHTSHKDSIPASDDHKGASSSLGAEQDQTAEASASSKRRVNEEVAGAEDHKKSRVGDGAKVEEEEEKEKEKEEEEEEEEQSSESEGYGIFKADGVEFRLELKELRERVEKKRMMEDDDRFSDDDAPVERFLIDTGPPIAAPFSHRVVSTKPNQITNFYTINRQEILGGGRFGQVHRCIENSSGLTFAAKIIKAKSLKEKEVVKNEIQVMNQLDHSSLIQLYAAYESRNDIILVLEYVDGGELFDRIIDENYKLKELDAVVFVKQICEGLQHMHKMYILHLDLKPENIMCVSRVTNKVKIIDFGLARIYKPREKLRVNFGTPEFLAPEVINFDFVSFSTDMWSLGVIAYMLLSGLCPFLGDDDNETLNNILNCRWSFEEDEFIDTSDEAKEFISKCLVFNKSWRIGAAEALRQPWLSDSVLHHRLHSRKTMCRSRRASCIPPTNT